MAFAQFLDLDRIEVLRGPQGTLYGRNAVGGAINLISKPPTNEFQASADLTAGNFGELRVAARTSGPLKRDSVMGPWSRSRAASATATSATSSIRTIRSAATMSPRHAVSCAWSSIAGPICCWSSDVDRSAWHAFDIQQGAGGKAGFHFDNPPDFHDVRASVARLNRTLHYGASARLTMALTPSTTLVSLTAFRNLDHEFLVDADVTELDLVTTHQHELQHQLSEELDDLAPVSRMTWVGGVFLFDEFDRQIFWIDQPAAGFQLALDPRVDATSRALFGQATVGLTSRLSATAGVRYTHERKDIDNAGGRYSLEPRTWRFPARCTDIPIPSRTMPWTPKFGLEMKLPTDALAYLSATRGFKSGGFNLSSTVAGRGYAPEWAWSYEGGWKGALMGGRSRFERVCLRDGLHGSAGADAHRDRGPRHPQCRSRDDSRRRSGEHVTDRARHRSRGPCDLA